MITPGAAAPEAWCPRTISRRAVRLRYTAAGSSTPNDMILSPASLNTVHATGQDPSHTINCGLYLAVGAGALADLGGSGAARCRLCYLEDPWDVQRLRDACGAMSACWTTRRLRPFSTTVSPTDAELATDAALDQWLLQNVTSSYHIAGTCKMGTRLDPLAVVDQRCRVHGLAGLRGGCLDHAGRGTCQHQCHDHDDC